MVCSNRFSGQTAKAVTTNLQNHKFWVLGVIEKVERKPNFLLVVTEVDISSQFLRPHNDPANIMYRFEELNELAGMRALTDAQVTQMERSLPAEARDRMAKPPAWGVVLRWLTANSDSIWRTVRRSNPFRLAGEMTTMIATAFSLMIVIFFSPEIWDVGSTR